jgi:hypothetical protein
MNWILTAITVFTLFATLFMVFLTWLAKDSKDAFARKLRILGWSGVALGYLITALDLFGYLSFLY